MPKTQPITDEINKAFGRNVLCHKDTLKTYLKTVQELREQHATYRSELPTDPEDAKKQALRILHKDAEDHPIELTRARHLSVALGALCEHGDFDGDNMDRMAAKWIAETISYDLREVCSQLDLVSDIISAPWSGVDFEA